MEPLPSRAWSCQTLQRGLHLTGAMSLAMDACGEPDVQAMEAELAALEAQEFPRMIPGFPHTTKYNITYITVFICYTINTCVHFNKCLRSVRLCTIVRSRPLLVWNGNSNPQESFKTRLIFVWVGCQQYAKWEWSPQNPGSFDAPKVDPKKVSKHHLVKRWSPKPFIRSGISWAVTFLLAPQVEGYSFFSPGNTSQRSLWEIGSLWFTP